MHKQDLNIDRTIVEEQISTTTSLPTLMDLENVPPTASVMEIEFVARENVKVWNKIFLREIKYPQI